MKGMAKCFVLISVFMSSVILADTASKKVIWSCKLPYGKENILWLVEWDDESYIKVFDERIPAKYKMSGLEKRWNWGLDEDLTYNYAITMGPDLYASYYDFTTSKDGTAIAQEKYKCTKG